MPYDKMSDAPENMKTMDGVKLSLSQINWIARVADGIPKGQVDNPWAVAKANFKKSHKIEDGKWVKKDKEEKEFSYTEVRKEDDGRYWITAISTAAVKDKVGETFETRAIDYDIALAKETGVYPEFRLFHKKGLAVGKVEKMSRVGIFAVDEGHSYDDPFSLQVCEKMLVNNEDGKWKNSRGFYVHEVSGNCENCGEGLIVTKEHLLFGFKCPTCMKVYINKGALNGIHYRKTRTFDVTITDNPAVPVTGVSARKINSLEDFTMKKEDLRKKLVEAGIDEAVVDERLEKINSETLKEYDEIPFAEVLKEFEDDSDSDEEYFVLDPEVMKDFEDVVETVVTRVFKEKIDSVVKEAVSTALSETNLEISLDDADVQLKEFPAVGELVDSVKELKEAVGKLLEEDEKRLKELMKETPRSAKLRIKRYKGGGKMEGEDEEEDMEEEEETEEKELVFGANGETSNMTEFILGK